MTDLTGKGKPFHSALDRALATLPEKASPEQIVNHLLKIGVKPQELIDRRMDKEIGAPLIPRERTVKLKKPDNKGRTEIVEPYFETTSVKGAKAMPRSAVEELAAKNPMLAPIEKVFGEEPSPEDIVRETNNDIRHYAGEYASDNSDTSGEYRELMAQEARRLRGRHRGEMAQRAKEFLTSPTHHDEYTLPGGDNYREILIKAPKGTEQFGGVQHHFGGEKGILASMRVKDRIMPGEMGFTVVNKRSGNKSPHYNTMEEAQAAVQNMPESIRPMLSITQSQGPDRKLLHLEELQSDWHQQGRDKGYHDPEKLAQAAETVKELKEEHKRLGIVQSQTESEEERNAISEQRLAIMGQIRDATIMPSDHVPDAPFKKNWEEVALKRLIHHAAEKGYHGIVVTPGEEQADRYSLAKQIGSLGYNPEEGHLQAYGHDRRPVFNEKNVPKEKVADYIGKEAADRLLSAPVQGKHHLLEGEDIKVGGEGMKGFYDKKVPNILNALGKKHGVKTQLYGHRLHDIPPLPEDHEPEDVESHAKMANTQLHHFPITEDMRKDIMTNGLPLYKEGGNVKAKSTNDMRSELLKRHQKGERLSKAENEALGLYHRVGGGKKLKKPVDQYSFTTAPNPKVNMAPEKLITPEDLQGGYGMPFIGDSSMAGRLLTGAEGQQFDQPVELEGGHDYMRANQHEDPSKRAIWASAQGKISHLTNKAKRVAEDGSPVYGIHTSMSPTGVDFSHMPAEALSEMIKKSKITKKAQAMFDKEMRGQFKEFPGVMHPELHEMLRAPGSGNMRKHFVERMATDPYQEAGFPEMAMARLAVQHPNLMQHDTPGEEFVGSSIGRFRPDFGQVDDPKNPHHSYPSVIGGEYVGALNPETSRPLLNTREFFPEFHKMRREFNAPEAGDRRSFELAQPIQKFDQEWLDKIMPLYLKRRKKILGYADGGLAKPDISQIGAEEAPNMPVKSFVVPSNGAQGPFPMGGVDMSPQSPGQQMLPANAMQPNPLAPQQPQPPSGPAPQGGGNILQMTPQGQKMAALGGAPQGNMPPRMAVGGPVPVNNHPFMSAGQKPLPFMAKVGGSNNMPMNNNYSDNGATDYSIDNIQQLARGGSVSVASMQQQMKSMAQQINKLTDNLDTMRLALTRNTKAK